ncbi:MAG TPA: GGDEF domain-containing protein, partial [Microthrixaceae bacterium]|nr:GGDEF domain-containing protein [Microthrixaceae bacterium]
MLSTSIPDPDSSPRRGSEEATTDELGRTLPGSEPEYLTDGGDSRLGGASRSGGAPLNLSAAEGTRIPSALPAAIASAAVPVVLAVPSLLLGMPVVVTAGLVVAGAALSALITTIGVIRPLTELTVTAVIERNEAQSSRDEERASQAFRDRLDRALRSSQSEPATIGICLRAVAEILPDSEVSLLLNLPNEAAIGWRVDLVDGRLNPAVPVPNSPTCIGLGTMSTAVSSSATALDSCGHLNDPDHDVSSVCVPLCLGERTLGSVSATSAPGEVPPLELIERVEWVIDRAAVRVAEQRLQRGPSVAGRPDPVTGLPGPSALKHQLRDLVRTLSPFCVSIISIDAFDEIRYRSGEDAADHALGLAADALCSTLRPDDLVCRIDGPRFAVVLADCSSRQATAAMERFRETLALMLSAEAEGPFTCSAGIVESHRATSLESLI